MAKTQNKEKKNKNNASPKAHKKSVNKVEQNAEKPNKVQKKSTKDLKKAAKSGLVGLVPTPAAENLNETQMMSEEEASEMESESDISSNDSVTSTENKMEAEEANDEPKNYQTSERTVFVENLPSQTTELQLTYLFIPYGEVDKIFFQTASGKIVPHNTYKVRSESNSLNAYIVMKDAVSAAKALALNGVKIKENCLRVSKSSISPTLNSDTKVYVGNLEHSATVKKINQIFGNCGEIKYVKTVQTANKEGCEGRALVCFDNLNSVGLAFELNGTIVDNRPIIVRPYVTKKPLQNKSFQGRKQHFKGNHRIVTKPFKEFYNPLVMVYLKNLSHNANEEKLQKLFSTCGEIMRVQIFKTVDNKHCSGRAIVYFKSPYSVGLALKLNRKLIDKRQLVVEPFLPKIQENGKNSDGKHKMQQNGRNSDKNEQNTDKNEDNLNEKKKKSEFRGVKKEGIKKQKHKPQGQMKKLANKIAPTDEGNETD